MNELKPCPYCGHDMDIMTGIGRGGDAEYILYCTNVRCSLNSLFDRLKFDTRRDAVKANNTRHEMVCHMEDGLFKTCSECGPLLDDEYNYCPKCGAKVVNE